MRAAYPRVTYEPEREYRRSFLLLRWLLIILAAYLTLFNSLDDPDFPVACTVAGLFVLTNVALVMMPRQTFAQPRTQRALVFTDCVFVSLVFFLLRDESTYLYIPFALIFLLTVVWRDLKVVAFSLIAVSLLYGVFASSRFLGISGIFPELGTSGGDSSGAVESFLALALFFVVSIFYLFLSDRFREDAHLSSLMLEEKRRAEVMLEITRSISSSLNSDEILYLIVTRLSEVFAAIDCSIVRLDPQTKLGKILVKSAELHLAETSVDPDEFPELRQADESREMLFFPSIVRDGVRQSVVAVPMLVKESVLGLIHIRLGAERTSLSEADERFLKVMSLTAANALRNAQLFEETEHRARTDFLTDLPNHGFFQSTLSVELRRAQRHNRPLSLLMIDLDFLKEVNDRFGHPTGDMVIRAVGETIRGTCRDFDFAARYGGEEYAVVLPETPLTGAIQAGERVRERIAALSFVGIGSVTASIGISNYPVNALGKEDLIRVADQALYVAKNNGRDRVAYFNYQLITR